MDRLWDFALLYIDRHWNGEFKNYHGIKIKFDSVLVNVYNQIIIINIYKTFYSVVICCIRVPLINSTFLCALWYSYIIIINNFSEEELVMMALLIDEDNAITKRQTRNYWVPTPHAWWFLKTCTGSVSESVAKNIFKTHPIPVPL